MATALCKRVCNETGGSNDEETAGSHLDKQRGYQLHGDIIKKAAQLLENAGGGAAVLPCAVTHPSLNVALNDRSNGPAILMPNPLTLQCHIYFS